MKLYRRCREETGGIHFQSCAVDLDLAYVSVISKTNTRSKSCYGQNLWRRERTAVSDYGIQRVSCRCAQLVSNAGRVRAIPALRATSVNAGVSLRLINNELWL